MERAYRAHVYEKRSLKILIIKKKQAPWPREKYFGVGKGLLLGFMFVVGKTLASLGLFYLINLKKLTG